MIFRSSAVLASAIMLCGILQGQTVRTWTVRPEWVKAHEDFLASDAMGGRGSATRLEEITAAYVASEFEAYGLKPAPGMDGYIQSADIEPYTDPKGRARLRLAGKPGDRKTFNAIGYLQGADPDSGTILLTAHLDHLGTVPSGEDRIYNGANDDASGTTAVLELAHALAAGPKPRRSLLFACYGSEEAGGLGSTYFGEHPPVPLTKLVANVEFEMIGNQDPKTGKGVLTFTGWERSDLGPALKAHGALLGPDPYPEQHFFERSDNYSLALMGVVAHTAAGWGTVPTYHRPDDDVAHLDLPFVTAAIQSLVEPIRWLAQSDFVPQWNPGGKPQPRGR
ncbi:MAG: M28 family peptidase [Rhodospirillales bacterium]|nr:M28 family peptidase [Acetobacter sp.]